ncbi:hypothetical protein BYT27DRAFT_7025902, partial [Phlegmacium glaucopus]
LFILSYVGIANAIGQTVDVPIIVRSLADSMAMLQQDDLPIPFDPEFLMMLDIGAHESDNKSRVVEKYNRAWWNGRKPRSLAIAKILDHSCLPKCLHMHKIQLASTCRGEIVDCPQVPAKPTMPAALAGAGTDASAGQCQQCVLYRDILGDTLRDFLDVHRFSNTMSTASKNQWHLDMRRASTFNLLHEAAVIKESSTPASDELAQQVHGINTSTSASLQQASIAEVAEQELHRLRALPPTSHKWTWGESLTDAEVVALRRSGTRPAQASHSGYDISLREG